MAATPILTLPLTSLTGFSTSGGTWTADANGIHQTATDTTQKRAMYGTPVPLGIFGFQIDIRLDSNTGTAGMSFRIPSAGSPGAPRYQLNGNGTNVTAVSAEQDAQVAGGSVNLASPIAYGTWITMGMVVADAVADIYINGTFLTSMGVGTSGIGPYLSLSNYQAAASWRNLKVWGPTVPW